MENQPDTEETHPVEASQPPRDDDNADAIRESRRILRRIQAHMTQAHQNLGATPHDTGLVQVLYHPGNTLPHLNYVTPRRNTAWIPGPQIQQGLDFLRKKDRVPRFYLIGGLYPPLFAKSLRDIGLSVEREVALMSYHADSAEPRMLPKPDGLHTSLVDSQDGIALWWYVWRNARYEVVANGIEPVYIGRDTREMALGNQQDIILYRARFPIGVARITYVDDSANITAVAILKEARTPESITMLYQSALNTALKRGAQLVFTTGETETDRQASRKLGFVDAGSLICYAESRLKRPTVQQTSSVENNNSTESLEFIMQ
jgi:hypothetical protein